jgi:hypothetical protein
MLRALYLRSFAALAAKKAPKRCALMLWHSASQITPNLLFKPNRPAQNRPLTKRQNNMKKALLDLLAAVVIAGALLIGALAYFDVLVK